MALSRLGKLKRDIELKGRRKVLKNLARATLKIKGKTKEGMLAAAIFVEGESNETVPVQFGVLINSSFTGVKARGERIVSRAGYTAKYADYVHEMPETNNFTKIGSSSKFLFNAVTRNFNKILEIIRGRAKV